LARAVDWFGDDVDAIRQAAPMHDIGKVGIPEAIRRKTDNLTPRESEIMKNHTRIGGDILAGSTLPMLKMAHEIALNHHERWDGRGYPRGVAGKDIPESARIVAVVDAFDSLTHDAPGRAALSEDEAVVKMQQENEKQFDPTLLAAFVTHLGEMRRICESHPDRAHGVAQPSPQQPTSAPLSPSDVVQEPHATTY
jgi:HD-GYP domain-containing protein (c-di-GMP phosphodiesterase class II)